MTTLFILFSILGTLLFGAMSPGPSFVLVTRIALANSRANGLAAALGMGAGGLLFSLLALFGLIALLQQVGWLYLTVKLAGGLYLIYLAHKIWRGAKTPLATSAPGTVRTQSLFKSFWLGFATQVANPKTAVVYASIFAVFLPANPTLSLLLLLPPAVFLVEAGWYALVALLFSAQRPKAVYLHHKKWFDRLAGALLGAIGVRLVSDSVR